MFLTNLLTIGSLIATLTIQSAFSWDLKPSAEKYWNLKKLGLLNHKEPLLAIGHEFHLQQQESSSPGYHAYYYSHHPHHSYSRHQQQVYPEIEGRSAPSKYASTNSNDKKPDRNFSLTPRPVSSPAPSGCVYKGHKYYHSQSVVTNQPCLNCTCQRGFVSCYLRVCPVLNAPEGDDSCFLLKEEGNCCASLKCPGSLHSSSYSSFGPSSAASSPNNNNNGNSNNNSNNSTSTNRASTSATSTVSTPVASSFTSFMHKSSYYPSNGVERKAESLHGPYNKLYPMRSKQQINGHHHHTSTLQPPYQKQDTTYWSSHSPRPISSTMSPLRSPSRPYVLPLTQTTSRPRPFTSSSSSSSTSSLASGLNRKPSTYNKTYPPPPTFSQRRPLYPVSNSKHQNLNKRPISSSTLVASSTSPAVASIDRNRNKIPSSSSSSSSSSLSNDFVTSSSIDNSNLQGFSSGSSNSNSYKDPNESFSFFRLSSILV